MLATLVALRHAPFNNHRYWHGQHLQRWPRPYMCTCDDRSRIHTGWVTSQARPETPGSLRHNGLRHCGIARIEMVVPWWPLHCTYRLHARWWSQGAVQCNYLASLRRESWLQGRQVDIVLFVNNPNATCLLQIVDCERDGLHCQGRASSNAHHGCHLLAPTYSGKQLQHR